MVKSQTISVGDSYGGPLNDQGKTHFLSQNNKTQAIPQIINHTQDNHAPVAGAHGPSNLSGPPKRLAPAPLERNPASLEGYAVVPQRLRLA
jgi:hypothetical protein